MSDPHWEKVQLLLHMDGTNGSTSIVDVKGHSVVANNGPSISTEKSKFGGASCLSATNSYGCRIYATSTDFAIADEDFVHEFQFQPVDGASSSWFTLLRAESSGGELEYAVVYRPQTRDIEIQTKYGASNRYYPFGNYGEFTHLALVKHGSSIKLYCGGTERCSLSLGGGFSTSNTLNIAGHPTGFLGAYGYVDEYRFTKGEARYTTNFTPPTEPFQEDGEAEVTDCLLVGEMAPSPGAVLHVDNPQLIDTTLGGHLPASGSILIDNPVIVDASLLGEMKPSDQSAIEIYNPQVILADIFGTMSPSASAFVLVENEYVEPPDQIELAINGNLSISSYMVNSVGVNGSIKISSRHVDSAVVAGTFELLGFADVDIGAYAQSYGSLRLINGAAENCWCGHG